MQYIIIGILTAGLIAWRIRKVKMAENFYSYSTTDIGDRGRLEIFLGIGDESGNVEIVLEIVAIMAIIMIAIIAIFL